MTFLCPGYPDRGLSPGPGLVAGHAAPGEAMRAAGVLAGSDQLSPAKRPSSSRSRTGEPTSATAPMGSGPQRQSCGFLAAAHAWASVKTWRGRASRSS